MESSSPLELSSTIEDPAAVKGMESANMDKMFMPQVSVEDTPSVGKTFKTADDAYVFYNNYAKVAGFSTRKANCNKNKAGEYRMRIFTCSREGKTDEKWQEKEKHTQLRTCERNRGHTRCLCRASMSIRKLKDADEWIISKIVVEHTHPLSTPGKVHLLSSHRKMTKAKKKLVDNLSKANVPTCQQLRIMEVDSGGPSSVGCLERDIRNYQRDLRQELLGHDAESLVNYFEKEKHRNRHFSYTYETHVIETTKGKQEKMFKRCFWADCESRNAFAHFGDALVFDTTYNTNAYSMIFATFVGVNHHRQTVVFGCGFLSDETTESFKWLFSQFIACMPERSTPKIIITDQDQALCNAVSESFPTVVHRLCLWHIENKFSEKLGPFLYNQYKSTICNIIRDSETPEEFEKRWGQLMSTTQLGGNKWLCVMYEIRSRWVPAYVKHIFSAGMSSSQRVEASHAFIKRYVMRENSLMDFIARYSMAIMHQRHQELMATHIDLSQVPRTTTLFHMEIQMARIYTKTIFLLFQAELKQSVSYKSKKISIIDECKVYEVRRDVGNVSSDSVHILTWLTVSDFITCSCKLFEFHGYPCRHILSLLHKKEIKILSEHYILKRWTQKAKSQPVFEGSKEFEAGESLVSRHSTLATEVMEMVDEASLTPEISNFVLREVRNLKRQIRERLEASRVTVPEVGAGTKRSRDEPPNVVDPQPVRAKGSGKRLKSSKEKGMGQRKCGYCNASGHNIKTCPKLQSSSHLVDQEDADHPNISFLESSATNGADDNVHTYDGLEDGGI